VVGGVNYGESNRIVRLLTASRGRVSVMAYRARSASSRKRGLFDLGTTIRVQLKRGRGSLMNVAEVDYIAGPNHARSEIGRLLLLSYACEVMSALAPEEAEASRLYGLLRVLVEVLEHERSPVDATRLALEAKALTFAGLMPSLFVCCVCGTPLETDGCFSQHSGGVVHHHCGEGKSVRQEQLHQIERLRRTPLVETLGSSEVVPAVGLLSDFISWHLGREIKSRIMLDSVPLG